MEPSERAMQWAASHNGFTLAQARDTSFPILVLTVKEQAVAYDAGYLAALREIHEKGRFVLHHQEDLMALRDWLDRRIAELEGR